MNTQGYMASVMHESVDDAKTTQEGGWVIAMSVGAQEGSEETLCEGGLTGRLRAACDGSGSCSSAAIREGNTGHVSARVLGVGVPATKKGQPAKANKALPRWESHLISFDVKERWQECGITFPACCAHSVMAYWIGQLLA